MNRTSVNEVLEKVRDPAANAVAELGERATDLRDRVADKAEEVGGRLRQAARGARDVAHRVGDEVGHGYDVAKDYAVRHGREAVSLVQRHPVATIAIAAGLGVLIGGLLLARHARR